MIGRFLRIAARPGFAAFVAAIAFVAPATAQKTVGHADTTAAKAAADSDSTSLSPGMIGFEARRKLGVGYYLTAAQIQARHNRSFAQIVTSSFPGLDVVSDPYSNLQYLTSTRGQGPGALASSNGPVPCYVHLFVDGTYMGDSEISWIDPRNLDGVEYYDGTQIPATFVKPGAGCGALLIWTSFRSP